MVHAADAAYFAKRADQSRTAALDATDTTSRISHQCMCAAYEIRAREATAAFSAGGKVIIDMAKAAPIQMALLP